MPAPQVVADPSVAICHRWLAIDAEQRRLQLEWGTLEGWLMTKRNWYHLSPAQQAAIPEGANSPRSTHGSTCWRSRGTPF